MSKKNKMGTFLSDKGMRNKINEWRDQWMTSQIKQNKNKNKTSEVGNDKPTTSENVGSG
jgi:hypothetical protein